MKFSNLILSIFILSLFAGCAQMNRPSADLIKTVPVVSIGSSDPAPDDHIVYIPANTEFPVEFTVKGSVFNKNASSMIQVSFKNDMYLYKYWASLDGVTWINSHKLMQVQPTGGFDKTGGKVEVQLDLI